MLKKSVMPRTRTKSLSCIMVKDVRVIYSAD